MKRYLFSVVLVVCFAGSARSQQFSWHLGNGPFDGPVYSILVHPNGTVYVGGYRLFWTPDHYASWSELPQGVSSPYYTYQALALDSTHRVLVGTELGLSYLDTMKDSLVTLLSGVNVHAIAVAKYGAIYVLTTSNSVLRSADDGRTWTNLSLPVNFGTFVSILSDPLGNLFIGTGAGIIRSEDNGNSWQVLANGLTQGSFVALACSLTGDLYATNGEVFHSRDEGMTWTVIDSSRLDKSLLICSRPDGGLIEVEVEYSYPFAQITTDHGASWKTVQDTAAELGEPDEHPLTVAWDPRGEWLVGVLGDDGGSSPGGLITCTDSGLLFKKRGTPSAYIHSVIVDKAGAVYCSYSSGEFKKSTDGGMTWRMMSLALNQLLQPQTFAIDSTGLLLYADATLGFYALADKDSSRLLFGNIPGGGKLDISVGPDNVYYLSSSSGGIYRSTDLGSTWYKYSTGIEGASLLSVAATPWNTIYAGGFHGLYRSLDEGVTWSSVPIGLSPVSVSTLLISAKREIFVGTDSGLFRSTDSGSTWNNVSGNFHSPIRAMVGTPLGDIMAGTDSGIFYLKKDHNKWSSLDSGLNNFSITTLSYDAKNQRFIAGTNGSSFYYGSGIIGDLSASVNKQSEKNFGIETYPNPVGAETQIKITLQAPSYTKLRLVDLLGQEVKNIFDGYEQAGLSKFILNAANLPVGVYFLRLEANGRFYTKSILIQR